MVKRLTITLGNAGRRAARGFLGERELLRMSEEFAKSACPLLSLSPFSSGRCPDNRFHLSAKSRSWYDRFDTLAGPAWNQHSSCNAQYI